MSIFKIFYPEPLSTRSFQTATSFLLFSAYTYENSLAPLLMALPDLQISVIYHIFSLVSSRVLYISIFMFSSFALETIIYRQ